MRHCVAEDSFLFDRVTVTSAGTANWHIGRPMDPRARRALDRAGFHLEGTLAAFADSNYLNRHDVVIVMTREHFHEVSLKLTNRGTMHLMLRNLIEPGQDLDVPDPYYGTDEDFDDCLDLVHRGAQALITKLRQRLNPTALDSPRQP